MSLEPGKRLGPYEIQVPLGAGGMGEVYQAHDTRLNRTVAIKVMPPHFAADPEMKQRFDREAHAIASLNHPNICVLHDVGSDADHDFIVMELLEGETLAARLERGSAPASSRSRIAPKSGSGASTGSGRSITKLVSRPFTIEESLGIAIQIADALDKAHQQGIVHRDLKPANVMLSKASGARPGALQVKLLDFGLAKWKPTMESLASAVTVQADLTVKGAVLGTMRYMAPEQLEGEEADARTDIFALGTILYEVITGKKAFEGKNQPSLAGAIMNSEPVPISRLQPLTPPPLERAIKRCLAKDPDDRWQTAHDLLIQLRWIAQSGGGAEEPTTAAKSKKRDWLAVAGLGLGVLLMAAAAWPAYQWWRGPVPAAPIQYRVSVYGLNQADTAISPDGRLIALVARPNTADTPALYIRPAGDVAFRKVGGTDDAARPFWSPNSKTVAFVAAGRLKKVDASSGSPKDIGNGEGFMGGTWNRDNVILYGSADGIYRISAEGGAPDLLKRAEKPVKGLYWPTFLPDGRHYLYLSWSDDVAKRAVMVGAIDSPDSTELMAAETNVAYADPGYLVFHRGATVFAQRFDAGSLKLSGEPVQVAGDVSFSPSNGRSSFDVSQTGALIFNQGGSGPAGRGQVQQNIAVYGWRDRAGTIIGQVGEQGSYGDIDLSPNGTLAAITRQDPGAQGADIWVTDWQKNVSQKVTLDPGDDINPVWLPDGKRVAYTSYRNGNADIFIRNADSTGQDVPLLNSPADEVIEDWSKDGRYVAFKLGRDGFEDLYAAPIDAAGKAGTPFPIAQGKYRKDEPQFSYDGKWLAYTSDESATFQVYVVSFPDMAQKKQVTPPDGGGQPRWRGDGKELFYRALDGRVMVVDMTFTPALSPGIPRQLFIGANVSASRDPVRHQWSVTPDGQRFLIRLGNNSGTTGGNRGGTPSAPASFTAATTPAGATGSPSGLSHSLTVLLNWPTLMGAR